MTVKYQDYPYEEIAASMMEKAAEGFRVYQKFTCGKCGQRLTMPKPNAIYETGSCDKCGHVTNIRQSGCNYLLIAGMGPGPEDL
jgi:hypothetical protein